MDAMTAIGPLGEPDELYDPDEDLVPESRDHRRLRELAAMATSLALGEPAEVDSSLNFYPQSGERPLGPDAMVMPAGVIAPTAKSYDQAALNGPTPIAVIEVPSDSDSVTAFRAKLRRYQRLGIIAYVLYAAPSEPSAERFGLDDLVPQPWLDRPAPELGGISFVVDDGALAVRLADGRVFHSSAQWAATSDARAERLAAKLRELGVDPDTV